MKILFVGRDWSSIRTVEIIYHKVIVQIIVPVFVNLMGVKNLSPAAETIL